MAKASRQVAAPDGLWSDMWAGLVADLRAIGHDADVDLALLVDVLRARDRLHEVSRKLAEDGPVVTGRQGQVRAHPLLGVEAALRREVAAGFDRLGMSPRRRSYATHVTGDGRLARSA